MALEAWAANTPEGRFADLAAVEPGLSQLAQQVREGRVTKLQLLLTLAKLIGPESEHRLHPVAGGEEAVNDALIYLEALGPN